MIYVKDRMDLKYITILICVFISFYFVASIFLDKYKHDEEIDNNDNAIVEDNPSYIDEKKIVTDLYQEVRILYDVINSKFKVAQNDVIIIDNITYKRITNLDTVTSNIFTLNGLNKYISDMGSYFAYTNDIYYLASNLVSYQTFYFRGDDTNIYIIDTSDNVINAIIYEKWTSNNKNTLATIKVINENNRWLIDNVSILSSE